MPAVDPFLTCQQMAEFLGEYYDGSLSAEQRREFERHLAICPPCIHYLESYKTTVALEKASLRDSAGEGTGSCRTAATAPAESPPPEELIQAILAARRQPRA